MSSKQDLWNKGVQMEINPDSDPGEGKSRQKTRVRPRLGEGDGKIQKSPTDRDTKGKRKLLNPDNHLLYNL